MTPSRIASHEKKGLELLNAGCNLFNPIFELHLFRHLKLDPAVPTHGCITVGSEVFRYLRQRLLRGTRFARPRRDLVIITKGYLYNSRILA
jgi:hypothetical protein